MSTNRHSRIIAVLADAEEPLGIVRLTAVINEYFSRDYSPGIIGGDVKALIAQGTVKIDDSSKCFSLTGLGIVCSNVYVEEARLISQKKQEKAKQAEQA